MSLYLRPIHIENEIFDNFLGIFNDNSLRSYTLCEKNNVPMHVLLSSYALSLSPSFSLVIGARRVEQVVDNRSVLSFSLSKEDKEEITRIWKEPKAVENG